MSSINSILDIAKTSLLSQQKAISVTSHNISNANTEGYTRQKAVFSSMDPVAFGGLFFGTGVTIQNIQRIYDNFQTIQLRDANSTLEKYGSKEEVLKTLESTLNDFGGSGLSAPLNKFFSSIQDISNNPAAYAERSVLLSSAAVLTESFNRTDSTIRQAINNNNGEIAAQISEINSLSAQVADLNMKIASVEISGITANDLRDKRDVVLEKIAKFIDIKTMENQSGQTDVYVAGGIALVTGVRYEELEYEINSSNQFLYDITYNGAKITDKMTGGSLRGVIEGNQYDLDTLDKLNLLAATLIKEVNVQHGAGFGLDGSTGVNFFTPSTVYTSSGVANTGGAAISGGSIANASLMTLDDYEVRFYSATNYNIVDVDTGSLVVSGGAYTSGATITVDGLSFVITNDSSAPAAGDVFKISSTKNASKNISVSITDPNKVAASSTAAGLPGNNANALLLAALKDASVIDSSTFNQYYNGIVIDLGVKSNEVSSNYLAQKKITEELQNAKDAVSGVSIEEEAINLIKLQRAYEAAAKVMTTADKMLEVLLSMR